MNKEIGLNLLKLLKRIESNSDDYMYNMLKNVINDLEDIICQCFNKPHEEPYTNLIGDYTANEVSEEEIINKLSC